MFKKLSLMIFCFFYSFLPLNATEIYVLRHGQSEHNLQHLMSSSSAHTLTDRGQEQIVKSAKEIASLAKIDYIISSPLLRTRQTAQIAAKCLGIDVEDIIIDARLREQYFGSFEGKTYDEYSAQFGDQNDEFILGAPDGESGREVYIRIQGFLQELEAKREYEGKNILIVTHAYPVCQISKYFTGKYDEVPETGSWVHFSMNIGFHGAENSTRTSK